MLFINKKPLVRYVDDIVLVQPKVGTWDVVAKRLPQALLSIAALPDEAGYNVKIIDQRTDKNWKKTLLKSLKSGLICVGITSMTGTQLHYALNISKLVKENSDAPVVWGGVHTSLLPAQTLKKENIDVVVQGEGEVTFYELVQALEKEKSLKDVKGIWYKEDGKIERNPEREFIDLNEIPDLPYHLVNIKDYSTFDLSGTGKQALTIITSRGCPFRCTFCFNTVVNKRKWRALSVENTLKRIKRLIDEFGVNTFYIEDDNLCGDLKRFRGIINGIVEEDLDILWGAGGIRADSIAKMDRDFLKLVEKSGCRNLDIGAESGSPRMLKLMLKDITVPTIIDVNKKLSTFPFTIKYTFIVGAPTETESELLSTVRLALKLSKDNKHAYPLFPIFTPYPGTAMFNLAVENGLKPPTSIEEWAEFNHEDWFLKYPSWLSENRIKLIANLNFISFFANKNIRYKIVNKPIKLLFDLYHPIAKFRFKHGFYHFFIEKFIADRWRESLPT